MNDSFGGNFWARKGFRDRITRPIDVANTPIGAVEEAAPKKKNKAPESKQAAPHPRRVMVQVVMTLGNEHDGHAAVQAAIVSALRVGLGSEIEDVRLFPLANELPPLHLLATPPPSEPSESDEVIESYMRNGLLIKIYREAGFSNAPSYFATVSRPPNGSGGVIDAPNYGLLKQKAEARADRRAFLLERKLSGQTPASSKPKTPT